MGASDIAALVKQAVDILDVVGQVVPLRRMGNRHVGLCPFHQEKTPSFHVDADNQLYYCFGCGSGGDVLNFVMRHRNVSFGDAVSYLAERYHIDLPQREHPSSRGGLAESSKEREELYTVLRLASDFFYDQLHHSPAGRVAREYVRRRNLPPDVVETERIGYAPERWDSLLRHLDELGVDPELGVKAGLLTRSSRDKLFDRFRNRLIFPIRDEQGRIVAFGGRSLSDGASGGADTSGQYDPKYLNSPETPLFQKGRMLYQLARAREACRETRQVVLVEGYMDLLAFHSHGFYRVVATLGTALTPQQVRLLSRFSDEVVLAYDGDDAGERAMLRALPLFLQEGLSVTCLRFPDGMDPDDFLKANGLPQFEVLLTHRQDLGTYAIQKILGTWDGSTSGKAKVISELQPLLDSVRQPILKSEYLHLISDRLSLSEQVIHRQIQHGRRQTTRYSPPTQPAALSRMPQAQSLEESIVRSMLQSPQLIAEVKASGAVDFFQESGLKAIAEALIQLPSPGAEHFNAGTVYDSLGSPELKELFTRLLLEAGNLHMAHIHMSDWLKAISKRGMKRQIDSLNEALGRAQREGDTAQVRNLLAQLQDLYSVKKRVKGRPENVEGERN